jgi:hypothetical protein
VTNEQLQEYVNQGSLDPEFSTYFRAPGNKEVPHPQPYEAIVFQDFFVTYEAIVFQDFFVTRLRFPCKTFIGVAEFGSFNFMP